MRGGRALSSRWWSPGTRSTCREALPGRLDAVRWGHVVIAGVIRVQDQVHRPDAIGDGGASGRDHVLQPPMADRPLQVLKFSEDGSNAQTRKPGWITVAKTPAV